MENPDPCVLVIGGGMAGMAAAQFLNNHGVIVYLIERSDKLGGNASSWACMATDSCQNCGACLSIELIEKLHCMKNVKILLNSEVISIKKQNNKYCTEIKGSPDQTIEVDKIILATGFSPVKPAGLIGQAYENNKHIITTADLNELLVKDKLSEYLPDTSSPKIGFIQCVGSRNRELNRDYCSQVCCKISMRHTQKIIHLYPQAQISMLYIDLQMIGKETRSKFKELSDNIKLIQGVPFEIFNHKNPGQLSIIREKENNGKRIADHFDMIVLSVGLEPSEHSLKIFNMLDITQDKWGFLSNDIIKENKDIFVAGCAKSPTDIISSREQGILSAAKIVDQLQTSLNTDTKPAIAIFGSGSEAVKIASQISQNGFEPNLFGFEKSRNPDIHEINYFPDTQINSIEGITGNFNLSFSSDGTKNKKPFTAIISALGTHTQAPLFNGNVPLTNLFSLEDFTKKFDKDISLIPNHTVFWMDYSGPERKDFSRKILETALQLIKAGRKVSIIMQKMLVHGLKGQTLYDNARKSGVTFFRINHLSDAAVNYADEHIQYNLKEATLNNFNISFQSNWLVIPDKISPDPSTSLISRFLNEKIDSEGFLQSSNVRHRLTNSYRRGVFFAGSGHDEVDDDDLQVETALILTGIKSIVRDNKTDTNSKVMIDEGKCAKCLTCYRICPHSAIRLNHNMKPFIEADACFSCGLCVSNCPALAIGQIELSDENIVSQVNRDQTVVFACERSGSLALKETGYPDNVNVITLPCVCRISKNVILKSFLSGAQKIILAGCHENNCCSSEGSKNASIKTKLINQLPGFDSNQLTWMPVAANEPFKLKKILTSRN